MHGSGVLKNADGSVFVGHFEDDKPHGDGELTKLDGQNYQVTYKAGRLLTEAAMGPEIFVRKVALSILDNVDAQIK